MKTGLMSWQYITGFVDGEGHIAIRSYDNTRYESTPQSKGLRAIISFCQKTQDKRILEEISGFLKKHEIQHCIYDSKYVPKNHCMMSTVRISHKSHLKKFLKKVLPFLIVKKRIGLEVYKFCGGK